MYRVYFRYSYLSLIIRCLLFNGAKKKKKRNDEGEFVFDVEQIFIGETIGEAKTNSIEINAIHIRTSKYICRWNLSFHLFSHNRTTADFQFALFRNSIRMKHKRIRSHFTRIHLVSYA